MALNLAARERIARQTLRNRGGTFDISTGRAVNPTSGYAVAVESIARTGALASERDIVDRLRNVSPATGIPYVGTWVDTNGYGNDVVYIDLVVIVPDRQSALTFAQAFRELAIYDFATGESIDTPYGAAIRGAA